MTWLEDKGLSGCSPSLRQNLFLTVPRKPTTSKGNSNLEQGNFFTGNSSFISDPNNPLEGLEKSLAPSMPSSLDRPQRKITCGKRRPVWTAPNSSVESSPSIVPTQTTGSRSGSPLSPEILAVFPRTSEYVLGLHCEASARSLYFQLGWSELVTSTGARLVLESREEPGKNPVWTLTLKIREQNSGVAIAVMSMLLSMSFEVASISPTSCDGWIDTRSEWKSKDPLCPCVLHACGSLATLTHPNGGQTWTLQH